MHFNKIGRSLPCQALLLACTLALAACGGGGGGGENSAGPLPDPGQAPASGSDTAPVQCASLGRDGSKADAPFVATNARYALMLSGGSSFGGLSAENLQDADGAYCQIGDYFVSSDAKLADIAGNADYAIGSWLGGSYTYTSNAKTTANLNSSYVVYNAATTLPQSASFTCTPHLTAARSGTTVGSVTGSAKLTIENATAQAEVSLMVTPKTGTPLPLNATGSFGNGNFDMRYYDQILAGGSGAGVALGTAANGGFVIVAPWKAVFPSSTYYQGVAAFTCE